MEQLLAHLCGDYILQNHWMAINKTKKTLVCLIHCCLYTLPFLFLTLSFKVLFIIFSTHFFIDRLRLATYLIRFKNYCFTPNGFPKQTPAYLSVWITILVDNTLHLTINYLSLN